MDHCRICGITPARRGRCRDHNGPNIDNERVARALSTQGGKPFPMPSPDDVFRCAIEVTGAEMRAAGTWPQHLPVPARIGDAMPPLSDFRPSPEARSRMLRAAYGYQEYQDNRGRAEANGKAGE